MSPPATIPTLFANICTASNLIAAKSVVTYAVVLPDTGVVKTIFAIAGLPRATNAGTTFGALIRKVTLLSSLTVFTSMESPTKHHCLPE